MNKGCLKKIHQEITLIAAFDLARGNSIFMCSKENEMLIQATLNSLSKAGTDEWHGHNDFDELRKKLNIK